MNVAIIVTLLVCASMLVEFLVEIVKDIIEAIKSRDYWTVGVRLVSILFGLIVAFIVDLELLPLMGVAPYTTYGLVTLSGLVISAGSAKVYDLTTRLREGKLRE